MERLIQMQYVNNLEWEDISLSQKFKLFNKWSIAILIGNIFTAFGSLFYLMQRYFHQKEIELFIGFGCFFAWFSILRYFSNTVEFSVITRTFAIAIPRVAALQLGILPIFIAFILMGRALFWSDLHAFNSLSSTSFTLFAVANGDSVYDTFHGTTQTRRVTGFIYSLVWTFFGVIIMQNMNLVIIEDVYLTVKY